MGYLDEILRRAVEQHLPSGYLDKFLENPEFENAGRVHDWRNYVPEEVRVLWGSLDHNA